jgi:mannose-6-phosphate isomerase-like protein (cupin superfamily)
MNPVVSRTFPLKHYLWGNNCDGWNLVDQPGLSVKMERMPPHTAEEAHYHERARQFFFILKGTATFETSEGRCTVSAPRQA